MTSDLVMPIVLIAVIGGLSYAVGSLSSGYLVGKLYRNVDLRRVGSGSTGATNTFRNLGPGAGVLVALLDILKGATAVWIARQIVLDGSGYLPVAETTAAIGAVVGHCWPAFTEGRGGRGVATAFGGFMFIATTAWAAAVIAFVLAIVFTRIVSVASLASVAGALGGYLLLTWTGYAHFHPATLVFVLVAGGIIVWRHRPNIERIMRGAEPRVLS
jgi:glycerol-3-phosphate acyltransferase PlsY